MFNKKKGVLFVFFCLFLIRLISSTTFPNISDDVIGYYHLDKNFTFENETFIYDWSGQGHNGTTKGTVSSSDIGYAYGSYDFSPTRTGYIQFGGISQNTFNFSLSGNFSFGVWFKIEEVTNADYISNGLFEIIDENAKGIFAGVSASNILSFGTLKNDCSTSEIIISNNSIKNNTWYHAFFNYYNQSVEIYLNGSQVGNGTLTSFCAGGDRNKIGLEEFLDGNGFDGLIDEFIVYNKTLTATEILSIYGNYTDGLTTCGDLWQENKTYDLLKNVSSQGDCFTITNNNIILNGNNFTLKGNRSNSPSRGITINGFNNFTLKNLTTDNFRRGFRGFNTQDNSFFNSTFLNSLINGLQTVGSNSILKQIIIDSADILLLISTQNVTIRNSIFSNADSDDLEIEDTANLTIINMTFSSGVIDGQLTRKWYLDVYSNFTHNESLVEGVNITVWNKSHDFIFSEITDSNGRIPRKILTEYSDFQGIKSYHTNYKINATLTNWNVTNSTFNLTTHLFVQMNISDLVNPILTIIEPEDLEEFTYNTSLELNYTVTDSASGVNTCWYNIDYGSNVTISNCQNITFNTSDGSHTLYVYANDSAGNEIVKSRPFAVSLTAPAISLNFPPNGTAWNTPNNFYFNFTSTDPNGLDTCSLWSNHTGTWHKNFTWLNPTNATMNYTRINLTEGAYVWNIFCNDTTNAGRFASRNSSLIIDTTLPTLSNISVTPTTGSQTFSFSFNTTDTNLFNCFYSVYDSLGNIDSATLANTSINCNSVNQETVSSFGSFTLEIYANDSAGNLNSSTESFSLKQLTPSQGGGGGDLPVSSVVSFPKNIINKTLSNLQLAITYARIHDLCSIKDVCRLTSEEKNILLNTLSGQTVDLNLEELDLFIEAYNEENLESIKILDSQILIYQLFTGVIVRKEPEFKITPIRLDPLAWLILNENSTFEFIITSDRTLKNATIISGDPGLNVTIISPSTAKVTYKLTEFPPDFSSKIFEGKIEYISEDGKSTFQDVNIRAIYVFHPFTILTFIVFIVIIIILIKFRKQVGKFWKRITRRLK